ncbi:MAG: TIGR01777 family oxidoreductase [bacterium]
MKGPVVQQESRILISGASGFIGSHLVSYLEERGHSVYRLVRSQPATSNEVGWKPGTRLDPSMLPDGITAIINLSGSSIAVPFNEKSKRSILFSRTSSTETLVQLALELTPQPLSFISASGIGIYGDRGSELLNEESAAARDFVADVCVRWEAALAPLAESRIRTVILRTGMVLHPDGGALEKMLPAFDKGLGAVLGDGRQYMSWISMRDYLRIVRFALDNPKLSGPLNVVSPQPVSNREFSQALAQALGKGLHFAAPAWALTLAMGEMAKLLLLASQRVDPAALRKAGFDWKDRSLDRALAEFFSR